MSAEEFAAMNTELKQKSKGAAAAAAASANAKAKGPTPKGLKWQHPKGIGTKPAARGGHAAAATQDGKTMVVFGGADRVPKPYNVRSLPPPTLPWLGRGATVERMGKMPAGWLTARLTMLRAAPGRASVPRP